MSSTPARASAARSKRTAADDAVKEQREWHRNRASWVYWDSPEEKAKMMEAAKEHGAGTFSAWVVQTMRQSLKPNEEDPLVGALKEQVQRLEHELDYERDRARRAEDERRELQQQVLRQTDAMQDLHNQLARVKEQVG